MAEVAVVAKVVRVAKVTGVTTVPKKAKKPGNPICQVFRYGQKGILARMGRMSERTLMSRVVKVAGGSQLTGVAGKSPSCLSG